MTIDVEKGQEKLLLKVRERLDTVTAPELEQEFSEENLIGITAVTLDFTELEYISSAGLRVLLTGHKKMAGKGGKLLVRGANEEVREVFTITGFDELIALE